MLAIFFCVMGAVDAMKLRSWLGPNSFMEGTFPSARSGHGFAVTPEEKSYVFGGYGGSGKRKLVFHPQCYRFSTFFYADSA